MIWAEYLLLVGCAASGAFVLTRLAGKERPALSVAVSIVPASAFVAGLAWLQGGRLTGDFFAYGLWGRGTLLLGVVWLVGLTQVYAWMYRAGLPVTALTLIAMLGMAALAWARGNVPAVVAGAMLGGLMLVALAGRQRLADRFRETAWLSVGMLMGGAAMIAESGAEPHVPFSAWIVVLFLPIADAAQAWIREIWRRISVLEEPEGLSFHQRLTRLGWAPSAADRLYVFVGGGLALLAIGHYVLRWYGVHAVLVALVGLMVGLTLGVSWLGRRRAPKPGTGGNGAGFDWVIVPILLFAFSTRVVNLLHQGFLTWDDSRYAVLARDYLTTGDLGWTGVRPAYILLLGWAYRAWGVGDSIGGYVSLIFGLLSIALTYAWARQAFGRRTAIASAVILAASILHGWYSRWQNSVAVTMAFLALAGYAHSRSIRKRRPWNALLLAGASLGMALSSHYVMLLVLPVWLLAELACSHGVAPGPRFQRLFVLVLSMLAFIGLWIVLMPPGDGAVSNLLNHSRIPIGCCFLDDVRYHLLEKSPTTRLALSGGDLWYYWRAIVAFEGWPAFVVLIASLMWVVWTAVRSGDRCRVHLLFTALGPLALFSISAATGGDARARPLATVVPGLSIIVGLAARDLLRIPAARASGFDRIALPSSLGLVLLFGFARAAPLRSMSTPYASVRDWLVRHGVKRVVVLNPYGEVNGFVWKFYFQERAYFADTEQDAARICVEAGPGYLISAGDKQGELAGYRLAARYENPIYLNVPHLYDQQPYSRYLGRGLNVPAAPGELLIYQMQVCSLES